MELGKDRRIEVEVRERQHANETGSIPKATICSIETISRPRDRDGQSKSMPHGHNKGTEMMNSRHKGMPSPNTENSLGGYT